MKTFAQNLEKLMPAWATLPDKLIETFDWLEDQGWHHIRGDSAPEDHWLSVYPPDALNHPVSSHTTFGGNTLPYTGHWSTPSPAIAARIAQIGETSGDGGHVAIWLDDTGKQQFVHIGHDTLGVITNDPFVLLQFLAMGYPEPGSLEQTDVTSVEAILHYHGIPRPETLGPDEQQLMPTAFQSFIKDRCVDMPATARDLGIADLHNTSTMKRPIPSPAGSPPQRPQRQRQSLPMSWS